VGLALFGATIAVAVGALRAATVRARARRGRPIDHPVRYVLSSPALWVGVGFVAIVASKVTAAIAITAWFIFAVWFCATLLVRGLGGLLRSPAAIRRIGDPRAWRGELPDEPTP
jgi:hypothetical protein